MPSDCVCLKSPVTLFCWHFWSCKHRSCFKIFPLFIGESLSQFSVYYSDPCCHNCWTQKYPSCFKKISLCLGGSLSKFRVFYSDPFCHLISSINVGILFRFDEFTIRGVPTPFFSAALLPHPPFCPSLLRERELPVLHYLLYLLYLALLAFNVQSINRCVRTRTRAIAKPPQRQVFDFADRLADWLAGRLTIAYDACTGVRRDPGLHGPGDRAPGHAPPSGGGVAAAAAAAAGSRSWVAWVGGSVGRLGGRVEKSEDMLARWLFAKRADWLIDRRRY